MKTTEYTEGKYTINLRSPKDDGWAIMHNGFRLSREGEWHYEPMPSSRTDEWIKNHTFTLNEAKKKIKEIIKGD